MSYALFAAYALAAPLPPLEDTRRRLVGESQFFVEQSEVATRGWYDVSGFTADADLLIWWTDDDPERLQDAAHRLRSSALGRYLTPVWSTVVTGPLPDGPAADWVCLLPDVRAPKRAREAAVSTFSGQGLGGPLALSVVEAASADVLAGVRPVGQSSLVQGVVGRSYTGVRVSAAEWAERQPRS